MRRVWPGQPDRDWRSPPAVNCRIGHLFLLGIQGSQRVDCDHLGPDVRLLGVGTTLEVLAGGLRLAAVEQESADEEVGVYSILGGHPVEYRVDGREVEWELAVVGQRDR